MGQCKSAGAEVSILEINNRRIEEQLALDKLYMEKTIKLMLLGAGNCGKSTLIKQMKIINDVGFSNEEKELQKYSVYQNLTSSMATIIEGMERLGIQLEDPDSMQSHVDEIKARTNRGQEWEPLTPDLVCALKALWNDGGVQVAASRGNEFHLQENASHFLNSVDRISQWDYEPTEQDVLLTRICTLGVVEIMFNIKSTDFIVYDVGGQRSQRRKWIHCFDNVTSIIFVSSLSEYNQTMIEDEKKNCMVESMELFKWICNLHTFIKTSIILFLNKKDLFEQKIKRTSISVLFKDFKGPRTYEGQVEFIARSFLALNATEKLIYYHETCATDTDQVYI